MWPRLAIFEKKFFYRKYDTCVQFFDNYTHELETINLYDIDGNIQNVNFAPKSSFKKVLIPYPKKSTLTVTDGVDLEDIIFTNP